MDFPTRRDFLLVLGNLKSLWTLFGLGAKVSGEKWIVDLSGNSTTLRGYCTTRFSQKIKRNGRQVFWMINY